MQTEGEIIISDSWKQHSCCLHTLCSVVEVELQYDVGAAVL